MKFTKQKTAAVRVRVMGYLGNEYQKGTSFEVSLYNGVTAKKIFATIMKALKDKAKEEITKQATV